MPFSRRERILKGIRFHDLSECCDLLALEMSTNGVGHHLCNKLNKITSPFDNNVERIQFCGAYSYALSFFCFENLTILRRCCIRGGRRKLLLFLFLFRWNYDRAAPKPRPKSVVRGAFYVSVHQTKQSHPVAIMYYVLFFSYFC